MDDKSPVYRQGSLERPCESSWVHSEKDHQFMNNIKCVFPSIVNLILAWRLYNTQAKPRDVYALLVCGMDDKCPAYRQGSLERPLESSRVSSWLHSKKDHQFMDDIK